MVCITLSRRFSGFDNEIKWSRDYDGLISFASIGVSDNLLAKLTRKRLVASVYIVLLHLRSKIIITERNLKLLGLSLQSFELNLCSQDERWIFYLQTFHPLSTDLLQRHTIYILNLRTYIFLCIPMKFKQRNLEMTVVYLTPCTI